MNPNRNKAFKALRRMKNTLHVIQDKQGHEITLNLVKHLFMNESYKYPEYQNEMIRYAQQNFQKNKDNK